jgi:hypothetical protein
MFTLILLAINFATVVAGAAGEKQPGSDEIEDFIPCC